MRPPASHWSASTAWSARCGDPVHDTWAAVIDEVVAEAEATAPEGIYVEPKGLTVTLHFRRAPEHKGWVEAFAERQHATRGLQVHPGRLERELRPALDVDKGTVVRSLVVEHDEQQGAEPLRVLAAFGDDVGDLPAFAALEALRAPEGPPRLVVRVAVVDAESPPAVAAAADLSVPGATGAVALLHDLAAPPPMTLPPARRLSAERPPADRPTSRQRCARAPLRVTHRPAPHERDRPWSARPAARRPCPPHRRG